MKIGKIIKYLLLLLIVVALYAAYQLFGPAVNTKTNTEYFYLKSGLSTEQAIDQLKSQGFLTDTKWASYAASALKYNLVKPGRYALPAGTSIFSIVRKLKNGNQALVKLSIIKEHTKELLAGKIGNKLDTECDSLELINFMNNNDSLASFNVDTNTVMAIVMPYNYEIKWNDSPRKIVEQFAKSYQKYWTESQTEKAKKLGLSPIQVSILASIVEEETNKKADRLKIASTYLNRLKTGMRLQADPTVKFITRDFNLGRIMNGHLALDSKYNTYKHEGLPPGPICTPSFDAIEAVLNAPKTDYLYFVASYKFDGSTIFTSNYEDHSKFVDLFHKEQNRRADSIRKLKAIE
jgi:UPF0755 protein